jgi:hypothetical protein
MIRTDDLDPVTLRFLAENADLPADELAELADTEAEIRTTAASNILTDSRSLGDTIPLLDIARGLRTAAQRLRELRAA